MSKWSVPLQRAPGSINPPQRVHKRKGKGGQLQQLAACMCRGQVHQLRSLLTALTGIGYAFIIISSKQLNPQPLKPGPVVRINHTTVTYRPQPELQHQPPTHAPKRQHAGSSLPAAYGAWQVKASIRDCGKGHGWLPRYYIVLGWTKQLASSCTSLTTACSKLSPICGRTAAATSD